MLTEDEISTLEKYENLTKRNIQQFQYLGMDNGLKLYLKYSLGHKPLQENSRLKLGSADDLN